jgi:hypothetical protein
MLSQGNVMSLTCWKDFASPRCLCSNIVSFLKMEVGPGFRQQVCKHFYEPEPFV